MSTPLHPPEPASESERSAVVASPGPLCTVCGGPRGPRKREACSDKCRAALSRRLRERAFATRDQEIRDLLEAALRKLPGGG
jgi:predicted nucleic acid-binding Zn ribbon protein